MQMVVPTAQFEHVATETLRVNKGSVLVSLKRTLPEANFDVARGVEFEPTDEPAVIGRLHGSAIDGRKHDLGRSIMSPGKDTVVQIPPAALDHLGIHVDDVETGRVEVYLWVVRDPDETTPLIAVSRPIRQTMRFATGELGESE